LYSFTYIGDHTRFPYQMMVVSFNGNTKGVISGIETINSSGEYEFTTAC